MIKLFACDLDGTLLNLFHTTDDKILAAIREITDAGAHVAAATGRTSVWYTDGGFEPGTIEAVCANGSIIRGRDGEVLKSYIVDPAFLEELIPAFPGICFDCVTSDSILSSNTREVREAGFVTDSPWRRILMRGMRAKASFLAHHRYEVPLAEILQHDVCKVNCRVPDPGMERELHAFLAEHTDTVVNAPFNPAMFEITDRTCNKGESVAWLANYLGFSEDEVARKLGEIFNGMVYVIKSVPKSVTSISPVPAGKLNPVVKPDFSDSILPSDFIAGEKTDK